MLDLNEDFIEIANKIAAHGGRMYLVGGAVRDMQLNKEPHDMDFCITGISVEEFNKIFSVPRVQGKSFPVFILNGCEFALARKEKKVGNKHTDFEIETDKSITIEEDLARRDLTINSMAIDVLSGEIIDPFNGIEDIKNKKLRMTTNAYKEDSLRVYRTARFSAKLGFEVGEETIDTMKSMRDELTNLPAERVLAEFRKALNEDKPSMFFETLKKADVLDIHFKEVSDLIGVEQPAKYHPEGDAYTHTMEVLDATAKKTKTVFQFLPKTSETKQRLSNKWVNPDLKNRKYKLYKPERYDNERELIRFCALAHDLGKGLTPREEWPHHYNHEENGVKPISDLCKRIRMPKRYEKAAILTSRFHMIAGKYDSLKPSTKIKLFDVINNSRSLSYEGMEIIASCDSKKSINFSKTARQVIKIGVNSTIKEKCTDDSGKFNFEKAKQMVLQDRIKALLKIEEQSETINNSSVKKHYEETDR